MVSPADYATINKRSRSHNDPHFDLLSDADKLILILQSLAKNDEEMLHFIKRNQIDINAFGDEPATGTVTVYNPIRNPVLITDIIATWVTTGVDPNTSSVTNTGSVATPAAGTAIASVNVGPGIYQFAWSVEILGSAATLSDNFKVAVNGATALSTSVNGTAVGPYPNQIGGIANASGALQAIGVYAIATEATATYKATIVVTDVNNSSSLGTAKLTFGGRTFQLNYPSGLFLATGFTNGMQLDNTSNANSMTLTVNPPSACHLEFAGEADYRKVERL